MDHLPLSTFTISVQGLGIIIKTFALHFLKKKEIIEEVPARGDLLFDEAFCVVKHFFERASLSTVENLQQFGNNFTPSPYYVRVIKVTIPISTRLDSGKILINTLSEKEIKEIIGGREWWQRTLQKDGGINGEWISMKSDWNGLDDDSSSNSNSNNNNNNNKQENLPKVEKLRKEKLKAMQVAAEAAEKELRRKEKLKTSKGKGKGKEEKEEEETSTEAEERTEENNQDENEGEKYSPEMDDMKCTLAIHGGGSFFGSINSHRYIYWRLARKTTGRIFAVSYRLSPQFPFPCALSDALTAYLYLIKPPLGAKHKPVDPKKLTIIGDSFGGNITLALLCLIRDSGLPSPAGAVLVSPWCDLTHSFPSILTNTETDVVPPYGFLFKPSTLWPPPPKEFQDRANTSTSLTHLREVYLERQEEEKKKKVRKASSSSLFLSFGRKKKLNHLSNGSGSSSSSGGDGESSIIEGKDSNSEVAERKGDELADATTTTTTTSSSLRDNPTNSKPQKAEGKDRNKREGGGKGEVEEIFKVKVDGEEVEIDSQIQLYATNDQLVYPFVSPIWQPSLGGLPPLYILAGDKEVLRDEIVYMAHRAANPAQYPIRQALLDANPERTRLSKTYGPTQVHLQIYDSAPHDLPLFSFTTPAKFSYRAMSSFINFVTASEGDSPEVISQATPTSTSDNNNLVIPTDTRSESRSRSNSIISSILPSSFTTKGPKAGSQSSIGLESTIYSSIQPFNRPPYIDNMIRERVAIDGVVRTMEPVDQVEILKLDPEEIGLIREAPVKRYLAGKALWDKRFKKAYQRVQKRREHHLAKSMVEETDRIRKRYEKSGSNSSAPSSLPTLPENEEGGPVRSSSPEPIEPDEPIEGIWNLHGERPPPSSIAARKDTSEARKLAHVLDTHYSTIHSLHHLWTGVNTVGDGDPKRQDSQISE